MIELLRAWVLGVMAASILSGVASALTENAPANRIIRAAGALAIVAALIIPLKNTNLTECFNEYKLYESEYNDTAQDAVDSAADIQAELTSRTLEDYIEQLALESGIDCRASVGLNDDMYPESCTITVDGPQAAAEDDLALDTAQVLNIDKTQVSFIYGG